MIKIATTVLYNVINNEIIYALPTEQGKDKPPTFDRIHYVGRHVINVPKDDTEIIEIAENIHTTKVQNKYRIIDLDNGGKDIIQKPTIEISCPTQISLSNTNTFTIDISINNTVKSDNFTEVSIEINDDINTIINLDNDFKGSKTIEVEDSGKYVIFFRDNYYQKDNGVSDNVIVVEVVE